MRSAMRSIAFQVSVYCSMNIWCSVWNIGPSTFQWKPCVFRYSTYVSASTLDRPCTITPRWAAEIPVLISIIAASMSIAEARKSPRPGPLNCGNGPDRDPDRAGVGLQRVPGGQRPAVDGRLAARDVHVALAARGQPLLGALRAVEKAGVDPCVLVNRARALGPVARGDEPQPAALLVGSEVLLLVRRLDAGDFRLDPDLEKVRHARLLAVELAVPHAATRAHPLHVSGDNGRAVAHGVLVAERALEDVAQDLHVAVAMGAETRAGLYAVLVSDARGAVAHVIGVVVVGEGEAVMEMEPAVVGVAAFGGAPKLDHDDGCDGCAASSWCTLVMSRAFACAMICSSALPGSAPACWNRMTFSRNTISVGIERMPKLPASSCSSSVLTLANTTSGCVSEAFS